MCLCTALRFLTCRGNHSYPSLPHVIPPAWVPLAPEQPGASMILLDLGGCNMCLKICASLSNICLFHHRGLLNLRRFKRNRIIPLQWQGCISGLHQIRPRLFQLHTPTHRLKVGLVMLADGQYYCNKTSMKEVWHGPNVRVFDCWFDFGGSLQICGGLPQSA